MLEFNVYLAIGIGFVIFCLLFGDEETIQQKIDAYRKKGQSDTRILTIFLLAIVVFVLTWPFWFVWVLIETIRDGSWRKEK